MAGPRKRGPPRRAGPITAGGLRPTRAARTIQRFIPGNPPRPAASRRRHAVSPNLQMTSLPIRLKLRVPSLSNQALVTNSAGPPQLNTLAANSTIDLQSNSTAINLPLTKFDLFPKLPPELRNLIWKQHLPGPRVVTILFYRDGRKEHYRFSATSNPILLQVCHEAREVVLLRYKHDAFKHPKSLNGCVFNFKQDILDFHLLSEHGQRTRWLTYRTVEADIRNVKTLAFAHIDLMKETNLERRLRPLPLPTFLHFGNLQKVIVIFTFNHEQEPICSQCAKTGLSREESDHVVEMQQRVRDLKEVLKEGKAYRFMFGNEWMPPIWEWKTCCTHSTDWRPEYLESLEEAAQIEEVSDDEMMEIEMVGGSDTSVALTSTIDTTEGESVASTSSTKSASMMDTAEGEGNASTASFQFASTMDTTEGEGVSSTSSETASLMGTVTGMEDAPNGD